MVRFILGRSGSGKTSYCVRAIVDALLEESEQPLIFLVPEQASYQAERAILADRRVAGYHRLHVLSFDRLQFLLLGKNTARPAISHIGRQMVVHRIMRDNSERLSLYRSSAPLPGFAGRMAQTIAELHQCAKTPEDIELLAAKIKQSAGNTPAALKFGEIGLILSEYLRFIEGKFVDADVQMTAACRAVQQADFVKGARLWVDGFAGFTASELTLLTEVLRAVADAQIALCLDPGVIDVRSACGGQRQDGDETGPFETTRRCYAELLEQIGKAGLNLVEPVVLKQVRRFSTCPALGHIERHFFDTRPPKLAAGDSVQVFAGGSRRSEVRFVARRILQLVKERKYRYRDIAVVASDIDAYEHYVRAYFSDYDIPFFIDRRKPLNQHALAQLLCSALQVAAGPLNHSHIFTYLKSDLVPMNRTDVDILENYCLQFGPGSDDWLRPEPWDFAGVEERNYDQAHIDKVRRQAIGPLMALRQGLYGGEGADSALTPEQFTRGVWEFLDTLGICGRLRDWIEQAVAAGDHATADEHRQSFDRLVDLFDELTEAFAGHAMSADDYIQLLKSALADMTLAFIPPGLDQVLVGSIERSRHPDLTAVFLIGATQRQFPSPLTTQTVLSDDDRAVAEAHEFHLAPGTAQVLLERQYLAYIAFTRPSELLYVTYPSVDEKGSAIARSQFVDGLESLFGDLREQAIRSEQGDLGSILVAAELEDALCSGLGRDAFSQSFGGGEALAQVLDEMRLADAGGPLAELGRRVCSAIDYRNDASLDAEVISGLFAHPIVRSSASRLGSFASCPYQHFARYGLELERREELKLEPLDLGVFYHLVLNYVHRRLKAEGLDLAGAEPERLLSTVREETARLAAEDSFFAAFARRSRHNAFVINSAGETVEDFVLAAAEMIRAGDFRPALSEIAFGDSGDGESLGRFTIGLSGGRVLGLDGKIDRVDIADVAGKRLAVVFDYKRRGESFDWSRLYHGIGIQLPLYMLALRSAERSPVDDAVGAFYLRVEAKLPKTAAGEGEENEIDVSAYKARGLFNGEFLCHLDRVTEKGWSQFYNSFIDSKGGQYGNFERTATLTADDFRRVLQFTEKKVAELAEQTIAGGIEVKPYRLRDKSPCSFCDYRPVCRFDWQINDYNLLDSLSKAAVIDRMRNC